VRPNNVARAPVLRRDNLDIGRRAELHQVRLVGLDALMNAFASVSRTAAQPRSATAVSLPMSAE